MDGRLELPLLFQDAVELLAKTVESFGQTNMGVFVYKHPLMSLELLMQDLSTGLPSNIQIMQESSEHGYTKCSLLITTGSNMSVNALKKGFPVISMRRSVGLTFEPLDWILGSSQYQTLPKNIMKSSLRILSDDTNYHKTLIDKRIRISIEFLSNSTLSSIESIFS